MPFAASGVVGDGSQASERKLEDRCKEQRLLSSEGKGRGRMLPWEDDVADRELFVRCVRLEQVCRKRGPGASGTEGSEDSKNKR